MANQVISHHHQEGADEDSYIRLNLKEACCDKASNLPITQG
jgi:hypothetical protein